jgi:hypothetical protein
MATEHVATDKGKGKQIDPAPDAMVEDEEDDEEEEGHIDEDDEDEVGLDEDEVGINCRGFNSSLFSSPKNVPSRVFIVYSRT